jgi:hypothetical protein
MKPQQIKFFKIGELGHNKEKSKPRPYCSCAYAN